MGLDLQGHRLLPAVQPGLDLARLSERERDRHVVVGVKSLVFAHASKKLFSVRPAHRQFRRAAFPCRIDDAQHHALQALGQRVRAGRVAIGDIDRVDVVDRTVPDQGKGQRRALKTDGVNRPQRIVAQGRRSPRGKPRLIELVAGRFRGPREVPVAVPDFYPRVIAAAVRPQRRTDEPRGNADRPARIDQEDCQTRARRQSRLDRFIGTLIRLGTLGRIANVDGAEDLLVENRGGLGPRRSVCHEGEKPLAKLLSPGISPFVDTGVRQHVVEKDVLRNFLVPRCLAPHTVGQLTILQQEIGRQGLQIPLRHIGHEEQHAVPLIGGDPGE